METPHRHLLLPQSALDDLVATAGAAETLSSAVHSQATSAVHSTQLGSVTAADFGPSWQSKA